MHVAQVSADVAALSESLFTNVTGKRPVPCVRPEVVHHVARFIEDGTALLEATLEE